MNDTLSAYPPIERFDDFVTWHGLEEALKGIRDELEPKERVVIEMQTQTVRIFLISHNFFFQER